MTHQSLLKQILRRCKEKTSRDDKREITARVLYYLKKKKAAAAKIRKSKETVRMVRVACALDPPPQKKVHRPSSHTQKAIRVAEAGKDRLNQLPPRQARQGCVIAPAGWVYCGKINAGGGGRGRLYEVGPPQRLSPREPEGIIILLPTAPAPQSESDSG